MSAEDDDAHVNQLIGSLSYSSERGTVRLSDARYVLLSPALFVELQKSVETSLPADVGRIVAQAAEGEGAFLASRYRDVFGYTPEDVLTTVGFVVSESGWGAMRVEMSNFAMKELVLKLTDSAFAESYGPSTQSVCHTVRGLLRGVAMTLFESHVEAAEVQCEAKGDACCRFVLSARSDP